jgi:hypothetical protein
LEDDPTLELDLLPLPESIFDLLWSERLPDKDSIGNVINNGLEIML